jgi:uncharacterized membrane protein
MADSSELTRDRPTYTAVGWVLLGGLLLSIAVMVLGLILAAARGGSATTVFPLDQVLSQLSRGEAAAVLDLGILLLFATPLVGVLAALIRFAIEQDRQFMAISLLLLCILAIGFAVALR